MPEGVEKGILKGMYLLREGKAKKNAPKVQLLGSGTDVHPLHVQIENRAGDHGQTDGRAEQAQGNDGNQRQRKWTGEIHRADAEDGMSLTALAGP